MSLHPRSNVLDEEPIRPAVKPGRDTIAEAARRTLRESGQLGMNAAADLISHSDPPQDEHDFEVTIHLEGVEGPRANVGDWLAQQLLLMHPSVTRVCVMGRWSTP